jgi:hypothetical protein
MHKLWQIFVARLRLARIFTKRKDQSVQGQLRFNARKTHGADPRPLVVRTRVRVRPHCRPGTGHDLVNVEERSLQSLFQNVLFAVSAAPA